MALPSPIEVSQRRSFIGRLSPRRMGLYVLLLSLSMFFAASLVGYFITRAQAAVFRVPEMTGAPRGLWLSSALLVAQSFTLQAALSAVRANRLGSLRSRLALGFVLGVVFVLVQGENWYSLIRTERLLGVHTLYTFTFYLLTGLHAAHVIGGLIPLGWVWKRARQAEYSSSHHEGISLCVQYWHFLSIVWAILFVALMFFP
ncbi:MAG TPA: cytochrome c oxidase subunit 3 [Polyangiaceae bacterium]|nr:cytochrome c oxidase subunit 3 [Polyangiaceae bacterium]